MMFSYFPYFLRYNYFILPLYGGLNFFEFILL